MKTGESPRTTRWIRRDWIRHKESATGKMPKMAAATSAFMTSYEVMRKGRIERNRIGRHLRPVAGAIVLTLTFLAATMPAAQAHVLADNTQCPLAFWPEEWVGSGIIDPNPNYIDPNDPDKAGHMQ